MDLFGSSVGSAGEVNYEGFDDMMVGAFLNDASGIDAGRLYVFLGLEWLCGDANGDLDVTMDDVAFLQAFYFECSTALCPLLVGDVNCDRVVNLADIIYLQQYLNGTGPGPCCEQSKY